MCSIFRRKKKAYIISHEYDTSIHEKEDEEVRSSIRSFKDPPNLPAPTPPSPQISIEDTNVASDVDTDTEQDVPRKRRTGVFPQPLNLDKLGEQSLQKFKKIPEDEALIRRAIKQNELLSRILTGKRLKEVIDVLYPKEVENGETIIKQGGEGSHMYVSLSAEFDVSIEGKGKVNTIGPGTIFGEMAILHNAKRLATIRATKPGSVWVLDRVVYQYLINKANTEEEDEKLSFLQQVPKLNEAGKDVLKKVAGLLKKEFFKANENIVVEGDKGDKFYIILEGTVSISKKEEGFLTELHKGSYFGELALLNDYGDTRKATVTANAPGTECLTLTRQEFVDHFGSVDISTITLTPTPKPSIKPTAEYEDLDLMDFKKVTSLGVGGFGRVELIQHKSDAKLTFALKRLRKIDVVNQEQQQHVYNENNIQMACRSRFIVRLYRTYKDSRCIYFLMEACLGGDLFHLMHNQEKHRFQEKQAKFLAGCVLEAIGYLHERGVIYRDLKPENLMIDSQGYVKLTDFGFAKHDKETDKTSTFAGTPEYVAPEIILNKGHNKAADYWAYGVLIYELLNGKTPFRTNDPSYMKTYNAILNGIEVINFPVHMSKHSKHLIHKLCTPMPLERLGCQKGGTEDIRKHKWFTSFEWKKLQDGKMVSPFKPKLSNNTDTSHFDPIKPEVEIIPEEDSGWDNDL